MKSAALLLVAALVGVAPLAHAHGPTRQKVEESISVAAPPDKVWALVGDFGGLHKWHPAVEKTELQGDAVRVLTLMGGPQITEELAGKDDEKMRLKYRITDMSTLETFQFAGREVARKTLPVDSYSSVLEVAPDGEGSKVTWSGKFYRGYLLNPPTPEGMSDVDAVNAVKTVYRAGLENLKTVLEQQ